MLRRTGGASLRDGVRVEVEGLHVAPGEQRRIHQRLQGDRLEVDRPVGLARIGLRCRVALERGREAEAGRQRQAGLDDDATGVVAGRVEQHLVPFDADDHRRHHLSTLAVVERREEVEAAGQRGRAGRNVEVEGPYVERVAGPRDAMRARRSAAAIRWGRRRAVGALEPGNLIEACRRRMGPGQPLRIEQHQRPGLDRESLDDLHHAMIDIRRVDGQCDRARERSVADRRDREGRQRAGDLGRSGEGEPCGRHDQHRRRGDGKARRESHRSRGGWSGKRQREDAMP